jgi:hypothetical protein
MAQGDAAAARWRAQAHRSGARSCRLAQAVRLRWVGGWSAAMKEEIMQGKEKNRRVQLRLMSRTGKVVKHEVVVKAYGKERRACDATLAGETHIIKGGGLGHNTASKTDYGAQVSRWANKAPLRTRTFAAARQARTSSELSALLDGSGGAVTVVGEDDVDSPMLPGLRRRKRTWMLHSNSPRVCAHRPHKVSMAAAGGWRMMNDCENVRTAIEVASAGLRGPAWNQQRHARTHQCISHLHPSAPFVAKHGKSSASRARHVCGVDSAVAVAHVDVYTRAERDDKGGAVCRHDRGERIVARRSPLLLRRAVSHSGKKRKRQQASKERRQIYGYRCKHEGPESQDHPPAKGWAGR